MLYKKGSDTELTIVDTIEETIKLSVLKGNLERANKDLEIEQQRINQMLNRLIAKRDNLALQISEAEKLGIKDVL